MVPCLIDSMSAELKRLHSPDVHDLKTYVPEIADNFAFLPQAMVGPKGEEGEDAFDMFVFTPTWMSDHHKSTKIVSGRHFLIALEDS
jgi:hypothetical protein